VSSRDYANLHRILSLRTGSLREEGHKSVEPCPRRRARRADTGEHITQHIRRCLIMLEHGMLHPPKKIDGLDVGQDPLRGGGNLTPCWFLTAMAAVDASHHAGLNLRHGDDYPASSTFAFGELFCRCHRSCPAVRSHGAGNRAACRRTLKCIYTRQGERGAGQDRPAARGINRPCLNILLRRKGKGCRPAPCCWSGMGYIALTR